MNKKERFCDVDNIVEWRHIIITILLALVAASGWAQKVWTNPGYRNEPHGFQFDVNEVDFHPDETVQ